MPLVICFCEIGLPAHSSASLNGTCMRTIDLTDAEQRSHHARINGTNPNAQRYWCNECIANGHHQAVHARKFDAGKPRYDLLPIGPITEVCEVFAFGAQKYAERNYLGLEWRRVIRAGIGHLLAFARGQDNDEESGKSHLAHAACCVLMLMHMVQLKSGMDNRFKE